MKRALVTGASSGIGKAFAEQLAARGSHLVLVARDETRLEALAASLVQTHGVEVEVLVADLGNASQLAAVEERLAYEEAPVDLLVNNAGMGSHGKFHESSIDHEVNVVKVNVIAVQRLTHAVAAVMAKRGKGKILNVSSVAAFGPSPTVATYAATKAFVSSFSQAIAVELAPKGVTVSCICPGLTRTEFQQRSNSDSKGVPDRLWLSADEVAASGLEGIEKAKFLYVPTFKYKVYTKVLKFVPVRLIYKVNKLFKRK